MPDAVAVYVSLPVVVVERTVKDVIPSAVSRGDEVNRVVAPPGAVDAVRANATDAAPVFVAFPKLSTRRTVAMEVEAPSAAIGVGENEHEIPLLGPGVNTSVVFIEAIDGFDGTENVIVQPLVDAIEPKVN